VAKISWSRRRDHTGNENSQQKLGKEGMAHGIGKQQQKGKNTSNRGQQTVYPEQTNGMYKVVQI
jgi:hypothetical protein